MTVACDLTGRDPSCWTLALTLDIPGEMLDDPDCWSSIVGQVCHLVGRQLTGRLTGEEPRTAAQPATGDTEGCAPARWMPPPPAFVPVASSPDLDDAATGPVCSDCGVGPPMAGGARSCLPCFHDQVDVAAGRPPRSRWMARPAPSAPRAVVR